MTSTCAYKNASSPPSSYLAQVLVPRQTRAAVRMASQQYVCTKVTQRIAALVQTGKSSNLKRKSRAYQQVYDFVARLMESSNASVQSAAAAALHKEQGTRIAVMACEYIERVSALGSIMADGDDLALRALVSAAFLLALEELDARNAPSDEDWVLCVGCGNKSNYDAEIAELSRMRLLVCDKLASNLHITSAAYEAQYAAILNMEDCVLIL